MKRKREYTPFTPRKRVLTTEIMETIKFLSDSTTLLSNEEQADIFNNRFRDCIISLSHGSFINELRNNFRVPSNIRLHIYSTIGNIIYTPEVRLILRNSNCYKTIDRIIVDNDKEVNIKHQVIGPGDITRDYILDYETDRVDEISLGYSIYGNPVIFTPRGMRNFYGENARYVHENEKYRLSFVTNYFSERVKSDFGQKGVVDVFLLMCSTFSDKESKLDTDLSEVDLSRLFSSLTIKDRIPSISSIGEYNVKQIKVMDGGKRKTRKSSGVKRKTRKSSGVKRKTRKSSGVKRKTRKSKTRKSSGVKRKTRKSSGVKRKTRKSSSSGVKRKTRKNK